MRVGLLPPRPLHISDGARYDNIIANITYPPPGPFVLPPVVSAQCDVYDQFYAEGMRFGPSNRLWPMTMNHSHFTANNANPCFNICEFSAGLLCWSGESHASWW